jgi:hypothetical protein
MNLSTYDFFDLMNGYVEGYTNLFGKVKSDKAFEIITSSKKIEQLILRSTLFRTIPSKKNFEEVVVTIGYFMFAKPETYALGVILAVARLTHHSNVINTPSSNQLLATITKEIIEEAKVTYVLTHSPTLLSAESKTKKEAVQRPASTSPIDPPPPIAKLSEVLTTLTKSTEHRNKGEFHQYNHCMIQIINRTLLEAMIDATQTLRQQYFRAVCSYFDWLVENQKRQEAINLMSLTIKYQNRYDSSSKSLLSISMSALLAEDDYV